MPCQPALSKTPLYGFQADAPAPAGRRPHPLPDCPSPPVLWLPVWPTHPPALSTHASDAGPAVVCCDNNTLYALHFAGNALAQARSSLAHKTRPASRNEAAQGQYWINAWQQQQPAPGTLAAVGTPFQHKVWRQLLRIPRGWLTTYGEIAKAIGQPSAARAVGNAVGQNPLGGWIPCHRVVPAHGLGHYHWGGPGVKTALLQAEGVMAIP